MTEIKFNELPQAGIVKDYSVIKANHVIVINPGMDIVSDAGNSVSEPLKQSLNVNTFKLLFLGKRGKY